MKKLFDLILYQKDDIEMGNTCSGEVLVSPTGEGYFRGEDLSGRVVPVGMGITYTPSPGHNDIDTAMILETEDGDNLLMEMKAVFDADELVEKKLMNDEPVNPEEYYYKGIVSFKTGSDKYKYLERKICLCTGEIENWEKLNFEVFLL
ncbi:MAG: DUF3237 family protein [Bacillota bacterium]|nr:DUF3237 family protein [Bacillota bacterium]